MFDLFDLKYLFSESEDDSRNFYRQDTAKTKRVVESISLYNKRFSETFFTSWISNLFLRYSLYSSNKEDAIKLANFERMHLQKGVKNDWKENLELYKYFEKVDVKFVDFNDFSHTTDFDVISLKICVVCSPKKDIQNLEKINEQRIYYYDMELIKKNDKEKPAEKMTDFTSNCPNCGAPTEIVTFGVCSHCQEMISIYDNVWKIRKINFE